MVVKKKLVDLFESPGEAIRFLLKDHNWTQEELSDVIGMSLKHVNEIIKDKRSITIETARLLHLIFSSYEAKEWLDLDTRFRLAQTPESKSDKEVQNMANLYKYMPISEMAKRGWISRSEDFETLSKEIKNFWNIPSNKPLDMSFLDTRLESMKFRKSEAYGTVKAYSALVWKQQVSLFMDGVELPRYDPDMFEEVTKKLSEYTFVPNGIGQFLNEINLAGVGFAFLPHLSKTYIDGASFVHNNRPVIALTGRYDRSDNFWFTLAHECCHVTKHLDFKNSDSFYFDDSTIPAQNIKEENEANEFASDLLMREEILTYFKHDVHYMSDGKIKRFAEENSIHPSIVVGLLAHERMIHFSKLHRYKETIRDKIPSKYLAD